MTGGIAGKQGRRPVGSGVAALVLALMAGTATAETEPGIVTFIDDNVTKESVR